METIVINVQLRVGVMNTLSRAELLADLRAQLVELTEPTPRRDSDGSPQWWVSDTPAVSVD